METQNQSKKIEPLYKVLQDRRLKTLGLTEPPDWNGLADERADSNMFCLSCGYSYGDHPYDFSVVYEGRPVFILDCSGQRLKL